MTYSVTDTQYESHAYLILYFDLDKYDYRSSLDSRTLPILKLAVL